MPAECVQQRGHFGAARRHAHIVDEVEGALRHDDGSLRGLRGLARVGCRRFARVGRRLGAVVRRLFHIFYADVRHREEGVGIDVGDEGVKVFGQGFVRRGDVRGRDEVLALIVAVVSREALGGDVPPHRAVARDLRLVQHGDDHTVDGDYVQVFRQLASVRGVVVVQQFVVLVVHRAYVDGGDLRLQLRKLLLFCRDLFFQVRRLFVRGHNAVEVHHAHKEDDRKHREKDLISCRNGEVEVHCASASSASASQSTPKRSVNEIVPGVSSPVSSSTEGSGMVGKPG